MRSYVDAALEAEAVVLAARIRDGDEPHGLVTSADVRYVDAKELL